MIAMYSSHFVAKPQVVVLAAGYSVRLGRPKALARIHGSTLLRRTVALMTPFSAGPPIVVVPPRSTGYRRGVPVRGARWVVNHRRAAGLSSTVQAGVRAARHAAAVLLLTVDLPYLQPGDVAALVARWRGSRRVVVARRLPSAGEPAARGGMPLILPHTAFAQARRLAGDHGLREWVGRLPASRLRLVEMHTAGFDIDTPQDLAVARRRSPYTVCCLTPRRRSVA